MRCWEQRDTNSTETVRTRTAKATIKMEKKTMGVGWGMLILKLQGKYNLEEKKKKESRFIGISMVIKMKGVIKL